VLQLLLLPLTLCLQPWLLVQVQQQQQQSSHITAQQQASAALLRLCQCCATSLA
jgi:hypothetical protein